MATAMIPSPCCSLEFDVVFCKLEFKAGQLVRQTLRLVSGPIWTPGQNKVTRWDHSRLPGCWYIAWPFKPAACRIEVDLRLCHLQLDAACNAQLVWLSSEMPQLSSLECVALRC